MSIRRPVTTEHPSPVEIMVRTGNTRGVRTLTTKVMIFSPSEKASRDDLRLRKANIPHSPRLLTRRPRLAQANLARREGGPRIEATVGGVVLYSSGAVLLKPEEDASYAEVLTGGRDVY